MAVNVLMSMLCLAGHRFQNPIFLGVLREEESVGNVLSASACRFERRNNLGRAVEQTNR